MEVKWYMDFQAIKNKINYFLEKTSESLFKWLNNILPRITDSWWEDCVLNSLSYTQHEIAISKGYTNLSEFNLSALLRIANKSWYDIQTVICCCANEHEILGKMITVCNSWVNCGTELPGKDFIVDDLKTIAEFMKKIGNRQDICDEIGEFISYVERDYSLQIIEKDSNILISENRDIEIYKNSLVYVIGSPEIKGYVLDITERGNMKQYKVFANNSVKIYFSGQIAPVIENSGYNWANINDIRSYLTAYQINNPSSQNLYSLNSARIDFVPYQFRPALKMIHADEPRILIADSVGVGKTIEAGLIIKELEARTDLEKIVVICPRPLVAERKWELEMKRFDEEFIPVDGSTLRQIISDTDRDGEWPIRYSKIIIPYSVFDSKTYKGENKRKSKIFGLSELDPKPHFDLVIVDEAHHIRNGSMEKEKAFAYKCTKFFCDNADAVVMLTATPIQTDDNDLFTIMNVLRPDIVIDQKTFGMMSRPNAYISHAVHILRKADKDWNKEALKELVDVQKTQWGNNVIADNPLYSDILTRLEKENITREERIKLISDIESLHSFATMLNRTRRRDIQDFCIRRPHTVSVEFTDYQRQLHDELLRFEKHTLSVLHHEYTVPFMMSTIKRQAASCIFGLAPYIRDIIERRIHQINDDPEWDFSVIDAEKTSCAFSSLAENLLKMADDLPDDDPKFEETLKVIENKQKMSDNKIMIFSTFRHTLAYLKKKLKLCGYRVEQIDGSVKDNERYALKERFELPKDNDEAIDILLFTEVGSEGLDYQFCNMMINYDLPWNPMRIEQRIGRIDRRGQQSEVVNIYNIITENTVDAEIYHRCMVRIGIFERSIGDCEEILGKIALDIEKIVSGNDMTDEERQIKLEQVADNEVRKIQELMRLEEEEKELFGFDLTEFTTSQEIRKAENAWLTPYFLQKFVENYINQRVGKGLYIIGDSEIKNLRLSATARGILLEDLRKLPGKRNALRRTFENYLLGKKPNHTITFNSDAAMKNRESFFITTMHPLARQAARYFSQENVSYLKLRYFSSEIPSGTYYFSIYAWKYTGFNTYTRLIPICNNEMIENELPYIMEDSLNIDNRTQGNLDWSELEMRHAERWNSSVKNHKRNCFTTMTFKLESLANTNRNRIRSLEQRIKDSIDERIKRMYQSELETAKENYNKKVAEIKNMTQKADIYATLLINGVITITKEGN